MWGRGGVFLLLLLLPVCECKWAVSTMFGDRNEIRVVDRRRYGVLSFDQSRRYSVVCKALNVCGTECDVVPPLLQYAGAK